ncbi:uncharacterized protein LOC113229827 [Hyposmocoma kahamanoa]|uniref:uncharacterized protein LOC113229827 n=1 Tax=Hyposmocoma kahamanoa TaxID=1477025 RepID=UPI000E6D941A|nr:uncharacterized protein LOC113229827 [Hyposmocoma kahamanoa]
MFRNASDTTTNRFKRSLEFGGEILKFFFGTLDAEDARHYDAAINACQTSETELFNLMNDNIHVVKSMINSFNSTISKLNKYEFRLHSQLDKLNEILIQTTKTNNELIYIAKIILHGSLLSISNSLENILNTILFTKTNVLHPAVITPVNLLNELTKRSNLINKRLDFPVPLNLETIHTLIGVLKLTSYYYNKKIVFLIKIPQISPTKYINK